MKTKKLRFGVLDEVLEELQKRTDPLEFREDGKVPLWVVIYLEGVYRDLQVLAEAALVAASDHPSLRDKVGRALNNLKTDLKDE